MSIPPGDSTENKPVNEYGAKMDHVKYLQIGAELEVILQNDIRGCEAKFTLFVAAIQSADREELLDPIPPMFMNADNKCDFDGLLETINATPKLNVLLRKIKGPRISEVNPRAIHLLHWILWEKRIPEIRTMNEKELQKVITLTQHFEDKVDPTDIFRICYDSNSQEEKTFEARASQYGLNNGMCGYSLDKYYSVLYNGFLYNKQRKDNSDASLIISQNVSVSLQESNFQFCWKGSSLGTELRCVALCQFICRSAYYHFISKCDNACLSILLGDIVRPRYLMFFAKHPMPVSATTDVSLIDEFNGVTGTSTQIEGVSIPKASANRERNYLVFGLTIWLDGIRKITHNVKANNVCPMMCLKKQ
ncbi:uncharacterized protein LOC119666865 [Teleopsis dalmanni]|uniref:uncharacterized protein LOC119666865 n=1 Tax=Teleopsis dalmanni TaxID=139649 RepID=UPI0018CF0175|nr:uncharacterized protein LOC119666865 [Teleopsis dalmanni]